MKFVKANMINHLKELVDKKKEDWVFLWTSNSTLTRAGNPVMGRGLAKQLAELYPEIKDKEGTALEKQKLKGSKIDVFKNQVNIHQPDLHLVHKGKLGWLVAFPVKEGYWEKADMNIIEHNAKLLEALAIKYPNKKFMINYPGIGAGRLDIKVVYPTIKKYWGNINNIYVYTLPRKRKEVK